MHPTIDIHGHIFRGKDIPLKGYLLSRRYDEWYIQLLAPLLFSIIAKCVRRERTEKRGMLCGWILELVYMYMGQGYRQWAEILSMEEVSEIVTKMIETFAASNIDLYVPLMIDYEYWFKNTREPSIATQIDTVYRDVVLPFKGKVHPFAPFDPARELAYRAHMPSPDGTTEKYSSIEMVKDAIRNKGFIGVKVYNTLGYRPLNNAQVDDERRRIFRNNQLDRYSVFTGEQFDDVLSELYQFCVDNQVPITAHCVSNGIEAYPGASFDFATPKYWRVVLDQFPDLHLNLAHFGWGHGQGYQDLKRWTWRNRYKGDKTWVSQICEMLAKYKFLFADVAHHGVVLEKEIGGYKSSYKEMCRDFPGVIQKKLLFGIDWHVITRMDHFEMFKEKYIEVLKDGDLFTDEEIAAFLSGNAFEFLGLLPPGTPLEQGWTKNRERLQNFYTANEIEPPDWFKAAED
jgi:predicted TIM-barrel fold metal-dependent hydrolase